MYTATELKAKLKEAVLDNVYYSNEYSVIGYDGNIYLNGYVSQIVIPVEDTIRHDDIESVAYMSTIDRLASLDEVDNDVEEFKKSLGKLIILINAMELHFRKELGKRFISFDLDRTELLNEIAEEYFKEIGNEQ